MTHETIAHNETHDEQVRRLAEESLTGEEQCQASQSLLTCQSCLETYNRQRSLWHLMTRPEYAAQRDQYLADANPARHRLYQQLKDRLTAPVPEDAGPSRGVSAARGFWFAGFQKLAWGFSLLLCVAAVGFLAYERAALREQAKKDRALLQAMLMEKDAQIAQLTQQMAERSREGGWVEEKEAASAAWSREKRSLERAVKERDQMLEQLRRPSSDALLVVSLAGSREAQEARLIRLPENTLLLSLQTRVSREEDYASYRLILKDSANRVVKQRDLTKPDPNGAFSLLVGRAEVKPGEYKLEVYGVEGSQPRPIARNPFRILPSP